MDEHEGQERISLEAAGLVRVIRRLAAVVRGEWNPREHAPGERPAAGGGWWVLALGESLDRESFELRDQARERLRLRVERAGIPLAEHVWVWDETDRAQLVLATLPTRERAERLAGRYRDRSLPVRVMRERGDGDEGWE